MFLLKSISRLGLTFFIPLNILASGVIAQVRVYNVNAIHQLFSENELAAKKLYHNKNAIVYGRVDKVDSDHVIIEGDSEFGRLFCRYSKKDIGKVLELRENSAIKVSGLLEISWSPFGMFLTMNNCRVA
tara:strand:- start:187 stop:573 length:387 start_codon:yes stop_codon:yes gene_type:complete